LLTKYRFVIFTLVGLLLFSSVITGSCDLITGADTGNQDQEPQIYDVTVDKAYDLIQENAENPDFVIIDVRTVEEYDSGYIEGAINIDHYSKDFTAQLDILDKDKTYLVYCRIGRRSAGARDIMAELGFREVYNMSGGIVEWEAKGLPLVR
jgi:rhodanese-related sulfurtransferase